MAQPPPLSPMRSCPLLPLRHRIVATRVLLACFRWSMIYRHMTQQRMPSKAVCLFLRHVSRKADQAGKRNRRRLLGRCHLKLTESEASRAHFLWTRHVVQRRRHVAPPRRWHVQIIGNSTCPAQPAGEVIGRCTITGGGICRGMGGIPGSSATRLRNDRWMVTVLV
jgi:hypothetical protein